MWPKSVPDSFTSSTSVCAASERCVDRSGRDRSRRSPSAEGVFEPIQTHWEVVEAAIRGLRYCGSAPLAAPARFHGTAGRPTAEVTIVTGASRAGIDATQLHVLHHGVPRTRVPEARRFDSGRVSPYNAGTGSAVSSGAHRAGRDNPRRIRPVGVGAWPRVRASVRSRSQRRPGGQVARGSLPCSAGFAWPCQ